MAQVKRKKGISKRRFCQDIDLFNNRCNAPVASEQLFCRDHQPRTDRHRDESFVYFMVAPSANALKIGVAESLQRRLRSIQSSSPIDVQLHGSIIGGVQVERWLHFHCLADRLHHEWFRWNERTKSLVARVLAHGDYAAESICPQHISADRAVALGGHTKRSISKLPGPRTRQNEYVDWNAAAITPLDFCTRNLYIGGGNV